MKYMGSKRVMLQNGFGASIRYAARDAERVVDLFSGSGTVAWYAAEHTLRPVLAVDLQVYSGVLSAAVISRTSKLDAERLGEEWIKPTRKRMRDAARWEEAGRFDRPRSQKRVYSARELCQDKRGGRLWKAYGGYYFSPRQAIQLDCALRALPDRDPDRVACRAALISAATYCAAAPGHTAQPFAPTTAGLPYIRDAWSRDPLVYAESWLARISERFARVAGETRVADAVEVAGELNSKDLVIVDPPYSAVQYSRFYHVLEAIARADEPALEITETAGRYPSSEHRPRSSFSLRKDSEAEITKLLEALGKAGCRALVTFPKGECSNGLSGERIKAIAAERGFSVRSKEVRGRFSTLGGNGTNRDARHAAAELILSLRS